MASFAPQPQAIAPSMGSGLIKTTFYKDVDLNVSRIRYARIPLNNLTGNTVLFAPTSSNLLEWKLPALTCFNLKRSKIAMQYTIPAGGAGNWTVVPEDGCEFRNISFGDGSGLNICDINYCDAYVNHRRPVETNMVDFLTNDQLDELYPCNQLNTSNIFPFSRDGTTAGVENASSNSYLEQQHLRFSTAPNTALTINRMFPLGMFVNSFLALDKDVVFGTDMYLRGMTNLLQRMAFYTNTPANPNANQTPLNAAVTATNCYLLLAVEENINIRSSLLKALSENKIRMSIPYPFSYRFGSQSGSQTANLSLTLTKNYGRGVKKITFTSYNGQELVGPYAYDHSNVNGTKISQIQTSMDGRPLTDYVLNCYNPNSTINPTGVGWNNVQSFADDYREACKYLNGSCIQNYAAYQNQWFYCDSWGVPEKLDDVGVPTENINDYLDLQQSGDHVYAVQALSPAPTQATSNCNAQGLINYVTPEFTRTLSILPQGIVLG